MPASVLSAFFVFTFITAITPGPNNILALATGGRAGFSGSIPVLAGICGGFFCVMAICGVLSFSFSVLSASFLQIMRYIGSAYLLWLAWKTAMPKAGGNSDGRADAGFMTGFVLQFVNVKAILYGITAMSSFILPHYRDPVDVAGFVLFLSFMGFAGTLCWACFGAVSELFFSKYRKPFNIAMALMLAYCAATMLAGLWK